MIVFKNPEDIKVVGNCRYIMYKRVPYIVFDEVLLPTVISNYLRSYPSLSVVNDSALAKKISTYGTELAKESE